MTECIYNNLIITTLSDSSLDDYETIIGGDLNCENEFGKKNCTLNYDMGQQNKKYLVDIFYLEDNLARAKCSYKMFHMGRYR